MTLTTGQDVERTHVTLIRYYVCQSTKANLQETTVAPALKLLRS